MKFCPIVSICMANIIMYENLEESAIPYGDILDVVKNSDYDGYIVSEYEEYNSDHSIEMLRRHLKMMKNLIK